MLSKKLEDIRDILKIMKDLEATIAELYRSCAELWVEDKEFWTKMEDSELKHAGNINEMIRLISKKPESYEIGHPFRSPAVQTFIAAVKSNIQRLNRREITKDNILFITRDIEEALLESKYGQIIRTADSEFQSLIKEIVLETTAHKDWLNEKITKQDLG